MQMNNPSFGDLPAEFLQEDTANVVVLPVAYDDTSTWIKGADQGPAALIEASANMELYDIETESEVYKHGIYTAPTLQNYPTPEAMVSAVKDAVSGYINKNKFTVVLGGEHSVSIGTIQAHAERYTNMSVLQLDAHTDLRDAYEGSKNNHACVMARAKEICPIVQAGIRSMDRSELGLLDKNRVFFAEQIYNHSIWIQQAVDLLTDDVYITLDLDVFDPSVMSSTGTPEPGGMGWYDVLKVIKTVAVQKNIVGLDIVELCPNPNNKAPDFLAAKLLYKILTYKFC
jgi:agmatinase